VAGLVKIESKAMDAWFEEDEQVWNHPKDPYKVIHHSFASILMVQLGLIAWHPSVVMFFNPRVIFASSSMA